MFDTVAIRHVLNEPLSEAALDRACFNRVRSNFGKRFVCNLPDRPQLTYSEMSQSARIISAIYAEESLPKARFGNNARSLNYDELKATLRGVGDYVQEQAEVDFDVETAIVTRVDACHNFDLGDEAKVSAWLNALATHHISRFRRIAYEQTGIQFVPENKSGKQPRKIVVYSKFLDVKRAKAGDDVLKLAKGILRVEPRAMTAEECRKLAKRYDVNLTVKDFLTPAVSRRILSESLDKLAMNKSTSANLTMILQREFGTKASNYRGFIENWKEFGANFHELGIMSRSQYFEMKRKLSNLGLLQIRDGVEELSLGDLPTDLPTLNLNCDR